MGCVIDQGTLFNCDSVQIGGIRQFLIMYNWDAWKVNDPAGLTTNVDKTIEAIVNQSGIQGYRYEVADNTGIILGSPAVIQPGGTSGFDHSVNLTIMDSDQATKNNVEAMMRGLVVCIVMKKDGTGEIYGREQGLKLVATTYNPQSPEMGATIPIELLTPADSAKETKMPVTIDAGDEATTLAMIDALTIPGV